MKKMNLSEMIPGKIEGEKGSVDVYDPIPEEIDAGVRIVNESSDVPKRTHVHPEKQLMFVISGSGRVTNGEITLDVVPGDFILLDSNEEHYAITEDDKLKVFEVKYSV
ncbi:MAG: cupin domain-containing protein [Candidatus Thorarchaeota archaeon]|jgi:mannose-6-phosphate isomerase-like protein (cupin superfamily)